CDRAVGGMDPALGDHPQRAGAGGVLRQLDLHVVVAGDALVGAPSGGVEVPVVARLHHLEDVATLVVGGGAAGPQGTRDHDLELGGGDREPLVHEDLGSLGVI